MQDCGKIDSSHTGVTDFCDTTTPAATAAWQGTAPKVARGAAHLGTVVPVLCHATSVAGLEGIVPSELTPDNTVFVSLSFEGPDPYAQAGGLGVRVAGLTTTLAAHGFETH